MNLILKLNMFCNLTLGKSCGAGLARSG